MAASDLVISCVRNRLFRMRQYMEEQKLDAVILYKPENVFYFSQFNPVLNSMPVFVIIPHDGDATLLVPCLRYAHALEEGALKNVVCFGKWGNAPSLAMDPAKAISQIIPERNQRIGMELDSIEVSKYRALCTNLRPAEVLSVSNVISNMKIKKDEYEIDRIRRAAMLVDCGMKKAIDCLRMGYSEAAACTEGQYAMRHLWLDQFPGSEICGFGTSEGGMTDSLQMWCLGNERIAYGCDCSRNHIPQKGDVVLPMSWAKVDGYHAENERTLACGILDGPRRDAVEAILEARRRVFEILRPGTAFCDLYKAAVKVFSEYGFGDIIPGRIGHGVGNSAHEFPSVSGDNTMLLESGMVITVEPGLMDASWGGARHSDTVLVTDSGYERLTKLDDGYLSL